MRTQIYATRSTQPVKRIDEAVRQYEAEQHEEHMRKARKASKRAKAVIAEAQALLNALDK